MKFNKTDVLDVTQMKWLDMKIPQVRYTEISRVGSTSYMSNEMARNGNTSCKRKWNGLNAKYFM